MRFNEIETQAIEQLAEKRGEHIDEIIPALAAVGGIAARAGAGAAKAAGALARTAGKAAGKAGMQIAKGTAKAGANVMKKQGKIAQQAAAKAAKELEKTLLKKGQKLPLPTDKGKPQDFEIDNVQGDEVVLVNPKPKPGEPVKTIHKKKDLDPVLKSMIQ
jgi:hypothetical protein